MEIFQIIPVLDLLDGWAVHAVKGNRKSYKPLKSPLFKNNDPISIIEFLHNSYNFNLFYVADLDAIMKRKPNYHIISTLLRNDSINILLDPGIANYNDILNYSSMGVKNLILGLETLTNKKLIEKSLNTHIFKNLYISVDMYSENLMTKIEVYQNSSLIDVIKDLSTIGVQKIILLDLKKVGSKNGEIPKIYKHIRKVFPGEILVGGGIKNISNIYDYYKLGFSGVLIGTALYDGSLDIRELNTLINENNS